MDFLKRTWAEIDLDRVLYNWNKIKELAAGRKIMAIVKADSYGHGAKLTSKLFEDCGAECFGVSNINEAVKLREYGITKDILVLGYTPVECAERLSEFDISQTVYCSDYANRLSDACTAASVDVKVHIKLDTGMSRIGFDCRGGTGSDGVYGDIVNALKLPRLRCEGIFTHFSSADSDDPDDVAFSDRQYRLFSYMTARLKKDGFGFKYVHCCNSAASALRPEDEGNLIRPGIILYGVKPAKEVGIGYSPEPVMSVKSSVAMVKTLAGGECVSYGRTYKTSRPSLIATLPVGYADGYPRALSNRGRVIINGKYAPVVGRVCMDQMMVDVTGIDGVRTGTVATVVGRDGGLSVDFDDLADICGTIPYELMCGISSRVPRVYIKDGKVIDTEYLGGIS